LGAGYDYVNNDQDPSDDNGHGTAVAGIVAENSDNGIGVADYIWACRLMPVKVLDADGTGFASGLAQGIVWATDHGARVLNLSLGTPVDDLTLTAAAQYAWLHGALVVAAAGNESSPTVDYPAALPNVLSVAASDQSDRLYAFSNSGARVAAPGENSTTGRGSTYVSFLGTSSAAPVVSGIAGLAFSRGRHGPPGRPGEDRDQATGRKKHRSLRPRRRPSAVARRGSCAPVSPSRQHDEPQAPNVQADDQLPERGRVDDRKFLRLGLPS